MPDMAEYGVNTSNTFALLNEDDERGDNEKQDETKKDAPARKKVEKKDKEKHGQQARGGSKVSAPAETSRQKKHEFDRRPGPGPQRKPDKRSGGGKWDKEQLSYDDVEAAQDEQDANPAPSQTDAQTQGAPPSTGKESKDGKDGKDGKEGKDGKDGKEDPSKNWVDYDEYLETQKAKRPKGDDLKPRAPRVDGDFRAVKAIEKEEDEPLYKVEKEKEKKERASEGE